MSYPNGPQVYVPPEQRDEMLRLINGNRRAAGLLPQEYPGHDPYAEGGARPPAHDRSLTETVAEHEHDRRMGRTFGQAVVNLVGEPDLPFLVRLAVLKAVKAVVGRWNDGGRSRDAGRLAEQFPETGARVADEFMGETRADVRQPATEPHRMNATDELRVAAGNLYDFLDMDGVADLLNPASAAELRRRADAVQAAIRATTSEPSDLPATLASVDDVRAECQRLGLDETTTGSAVGKWHDGTVSVLATRHVFDVDGVEQVDLGLMVWREGARSRVKLGGGISRAVFEAAILAARSTS